MLFNSIVEAAILGLVEFQLRLSPKPPLQSSSWGMGDVVWPDQVLESEGGKGQEVCMGAAVLKMKPSH